MDVPGDIERKYELALLEKDNYVYASNEGYKNELLDHPENAVPKNGIFLDYIRKHDVLRVLFNNDGRIALMTPISFKKEADGVELKINMDTLFTEDVKDKKFTSVKDLLDFIVIDYNTMHRGDLLVPCNIKMLELEGADTPKAKALRSDNATDFIHIARHGEDTYLPFEDIKLPEKAIYIEYDMLTDELFIVDCEGKSLHKIDKQEDQFILYHRAHKGLTYKSLNNMLQWFVIQEYELVNIPELQKQRASDGGNHADEDLQ